MRDLDRLRGRRLRGRRLPRQDGGDRGGDHQAAGGRASRCTHDCLHVRAPARRGALFPATPAGLLSSKTDITMIEACYRISQPGVAAPGVWIVEGAAGSDYSRAMTNEEPP